MEFAKLKSLKADGLKKSQAARYLGVCRATVDKYWDMDEAEYSRLSAASAKRKKKPDEYRGFVLDYLQKYPDASTAQIYDRIKEVSNMDDLEFTERTLRSYVTALRKEEDIPKPKMYRQYQEVPLLPPGYQGQVDMGEIWLKTPEGKRKKVYCFCMVLSHSRYKFAIWQTRPFTTRTFLYCHYEAFKYFGGIPEEIAYDQDKVLLASENHGDLLFTEKFSNFIEEMKFKVYMCRAADPESKGKVENVVKYVKGNFAQNRIFTDIDTLNEQCMDWLRRTGNKKVHDTTKKVPAEVFAVEKEFLQPVPERNSYDMLPETVTYPIRKDNVIVWKGNHYRVPLGSYEPGRRVHMVVDGGKVAITDARTGDVLAWHHLPADKGNIVGERNKPRETSKTLKELEQKTRELFNDSESINSFMDHLKKIKTRYYRDQLYSITRLFDDYDTETLEDALDYCLEKELYSAADFRSAAAYLNTSRHSEALESPSPVLISRSDDTPEIPDLSVYDALL